MREDQIELETQPEKEEKHVSYEVEDVEEEDNIDNYYYQDEEQLEEEAFVFTIHRPRLATKV